MTDTGTYIKMSDKLPEHRKIVAAGGDAAWLHICAMAYSSRNLSDGFIPVNVVPRLSDRRQPGRLAAKLVSVDLWHEPGHECKRCPQPQPGEYVIHDYLMHQRSASRVAEVSAARSASGAKGGSKSRPKPKQLASDLPDVCSDVAEANEKRSFAEGFTDVKPQAEAETETDQKRPPTAGAAPRRNAKPRQASNNVGDVIAAFVEGAVEAGMDRPPIDIRKRVGATANKLLAEGFTLDRLVSSARAMGATTYNDLAVQVRKDDPAAQQATSRNGHQPYRNPTDQSVYDLGFTDD